MKFELAFKNAPESNHVEASNILIPVGGTFDIPTARFFEGMQGESIMVGGLGQITGVMGGPNMFKSTILRGMMLFAFGHVAECGTLPYFGTYDTELTFVKERGVHLSQQIEIFKDVDLMKLGAWTLTDAVGASSDQWWKTMKEFLNTEKIKKKNTMWDSPIKGEDGKPTKMFFPSFTDLDSLTEFRSHNLETMSEKNEIGESGANTYFLRSGLEKTRFLLDLSAVNAAANHFTGLAAHIGGKFNLAQGPMAPKPTKDLQYMKTDETAKGVPEKFYFLPTLVYQTSRVQARVDKDRITEYPKTGKDSDLHHNDLNSVFLTNVRNKMGSTGFVLEILVSQVDGIRRSLTEFHLLRQAKHPELKSYGFIRSGGGGAFFESILYPVVKFSRNTVRSIIDDFNSPDYDAKLVRAINITSELFQMETFHKDKYVIPNIEQLHAKLVADGYDWDILLNSRGYWTFNQYTHPVPYLSILDLINMYHGKYRPYWYDKEVKKQAKAA